MHEVGHGKESVFFLKRINLYLNLVSKWHLKTA